MKTKLCAVLFLALLISFFSLLDFSKPFVSNCPFCEEEFLKTQCFYEEAGTLVLLTHKPVTKGHVLIVPQRHVERFEDLTKEEIANLGEVIQKVNSAIRQKIGNEDYLLLQKNGKKAGQSVPHLHVHYLPAHRFLPLRFFIAPWLKPLKKEELKLLRDDFSELF